VITSSQPSGPVVEAVWSDDTRNWVALGAAFGRPANGAARVAAIREVNGETVAVGAYDGHPAIWRSKDGRRWHRNPLGGHLCEGAWVNDVIWFGGRLVLVGGVGGAPGNRPREQPIAWLRQPQAQR
jgi:hypothetical protein